MQPWRTIDSLATSEGRLELRRRGENSFLITIGGRVLMTSVAHRSESALARLACAPIKDAPRPHVLLGGLGMGYTLRAALDELPRRARVTVVDLNQAVVTWCKGPLGPLTGRAIEDPRVRTRVADVARVIAEAPAGSYDAIILDLYEGPHEAVNRASDPLYGQARAGASGHGATSRRRAGHLVGRARPGVRIAPVAGRVRDQPARWRSGRARPRDLSRRARAHAGGKPGDWPQGQVDLADSSRLRAVRRGRRRGREGDRRDFFARPRSPARRRRPGGRR